MKVDKAVLLDLVPIVDLDEYLAKVKVEVALQKTNLARLGEHRVAAKEDRLAVEELLVGLDKDEALEAIINFLLVSVDVLDLLGPLFVEASLDEVVEHLLQLLVLGLSIIARLRVRHKVHALKCILSAIDAADQRVDEDGHTTIVGVRDRHDWALLVRVLEQVLDLLHLGDEELIDLLGGLLLHKLDDTGSLGELVEVLQHLNSVLDSADMVEGLGNDGRVNDLNVFDLILEVLTIVIVPAGDLDIEDIIVKLLNGFELLVEHLLQVIERKSPLLALGATEDWHLTASTTLRELKLALADFL